MSPVHNAGIFLIQSLFELYLMILLLRLILQYLRVDYYNPLTQFIVKFTNPVVVPLRRVVPGYWGIDFATVVAIVGFTFVKIVLITLIGAHRFPHLAGLLIWTVGSLLHLAINLFFYSILMSIILSWVSPNAYTPMTAILSRLTEPLLGPARKHIPPIAGFDISPIPVMIVLQLMMILLAQPLTQAGMQLALIK